MERLSLEELKTAEEVFKTKLLKEENICVVCGQPWNPEKDGTIGEKGEDGKLYRDTWVEKIWMRMGNTGKKVCSECYFK